MAVPFPRPFTSARIYVIADGFPLNYKVAFLCFLSVVYCNKYITVVVPCQAFFGNFLKVSFAETSWRVRKFTFWGCANRLDFRLSPSLIL